MPSEPLIRVTLFGYPVARRASGEEIPLESAKVRALLAYMALHADAPQSRDYMAFFLWPDIPNETARKNLRQALYSLKKALSPLDGTCLDIQRHTLCLYTHPELWVDALEFSRLAQQVAEHTHRSEGACPYCASRYEGMLNLYQGDFLQGFSIRASEPFEEWLTEQREFFRIQVLNGVQFVTRFYYLRGEFKQVEKLARRWLRLDPWSDAAYSYLIRALALQGRKSAAWQAYHEFTRMMREDLGVDPPPEAEHLMYDVQRDLLTPPPSARWRKHLPAPFPPLIGRQNEVDHLLNILAHPDSRLVTITGPGGIGKTRLAQELAHQALTLFPDGVYWIRLTNVKTKAELVAAIREALEVSLNVEGFGLRLARWLEEKQALLILDDVDAIHDVAAALVQEILTHTRNTALLVTARQPLRLRWEQRFPLQGLTYPTESEDELTPERAQTYPAVQLFTRWARQLQPHFKLKDEDLPHVVRITHITQGHPLALELAAGQMAQTSCKAVADYLQHAVLDVEAPYRDQSPQHRSLRALLEQIWQRLSPSMKEALLLLAGFDAPFNADMAQAIAQVDEATLQQLVDHSLIQVLSAPEEEETLWEIHPITRAFLHEQRRVASHVQSLFRERARPWLHEQLALLHQRSLGDYSQIMRRMAALQNETLVLFNDLQQEAAPEDLLPLLEGIALWFRHHGLLEEGERYFATLAERLKGLPSQPDRDFLLGQVLRRVGLFNYHLGRFEQAEPPLKEALPLLEQAIQQDFAEAFLEYGRALQVLGGLATLRGDLDLAWRLENQALQVFQDGVAQHPELSSQAFIDLGNAYNNLGEIVHKEGKLEETLTFLQKALEFYRQGYEPEFLVNTLSNMGVAYITLGRLDEAQEVCEEAFRLAQEINVQSTLAYTLFNLALIAAQQEDFLTAHIRLRRSERLAKATGAMWLLVMIWGNMGTMLAALDKPQEAERYFKLSIEKAREIENRYIEVYNRLLYARFLIERHTFIPARTLLRQALQDALDLGFTELRDRALIGLVRYLKHKGQTVHALALWRWLQDHSLSPQNQKLWEELSKSLAQAPASLRQQAENLARQATLDTWLGLLR